MRGVVNEGYPGSSYVAASTGTDVKFKVAPPTSAALYSPGAGPSSPHMGVALAPAMPATPVYHYVHPVTHEHVASLLPPDHPEMVCLQEGRHIAKSQFGILGILAAVFWFPLGIGLCLLDRRVRCVRCGKHISEAMCG